MNLALFFEVGGPSVIEEGSRASVAIEASRSEGEKVEDARAWWDVEGMALGSWRVYHILSSAYHCTTMAQPGRQARLDAR